MKILENNNRKFMKILSGNCLKANKGRNGIAVLAIILTAVLFMALTTVLEGAQISLKTQALRQAGSKFMVSIKNLTREEAGQLVSDPEFTVAGIERYVSNAVNPELDNMNVVVGWVDETAAKNSFMNLEKGHYPEKENEIACDSEVLGSLGLPYDVGSTFTLQYTAGNHTLEKEMTVCGIWEGMKYEQIAAMLVSEPFVESALEKCDGEYAYLKKTSYDVRGRISDEKDLEEKLDAMVEKLGYDPEAERGEEGFLIHHVNPVYQTSTYNRKSPEALLAGGIGALLILIAGYLIIYNIFRISVEKDIRLYGQLKTIGTSPKQIRYMVMRQGMLLSAAGIPAGLILGWLLGNALLPLVMTATVVDVVSLIIPPVWIWLLAGVFTLATVRISVSRPGRMAGKISPVEALKYHGSQKIMNTTKRGKGSHNRILSMAVGNLSRNKGKTVLVVLSITLSVVLLNSVLNYTGCMDQETFVKLRAIADFNVTSANFHKSASDDYLKVVDKSVAEAIKDLEHVTDFGQVYYHVLPTDEDGSRWERELAEVTRINQREVPADSEEFIRERMMYGFDENALARTKVIEGSIDYEKLCMGNDVIIQGFVDNWGEYYYENQEFHAGDVIQAEIEGNLREYTVMAVVGEGCLDMSYSSGGYESIIFAEPVFLEMFPDNQNPIHCVFDAEEDSFDEVNGQVNAIAEGAGLSVETRLTDEAEFKEMQNTYNMVGLVVSLILGIIGILNMVNVIMTGVIARQREFASMRSIGMTRKQLQRLMVYEGIIYAVFSGAVGILLSGLLSATLIKNYVTGIWFMKYHFTVLPAAAVSVLCLLLAAGISAMTDRVWNEGSIVEQLRECE